MLLVPDVPFDAPQTLAFRVPSVPFQHLREALRAAFERGEGGPVRARWHEHLVGYRKARREARWCAPRETILELCSELRRACAKVEGETRGMFYPGPADLEALREQCDAVEHLVGDAPHLEVAPERWIFLVCGARYRVRPYVHGIDARQPLNYEWGYYARQLAALCEPDDALEPDDYAEVRGEAAPPGAVEQLANCRFFLEDHDEATGKSRRGREVSAHELRDPMRDHVILGDGTETYAAHAWDVAPESVRLRSQLELLVGPFVRTRGPGPFVPVPDCAPSIIDPGWSLLPIFRAVPNAPWSPPAWWFLAGAAIDRAREEVRGARPGREWHSRVDYNVEGSGYARPPDWLGWNEVLEKWWSICRDRWAAFLEEARRAGDTVIFTYWLPDDQGTITTPLSDDLGALRPARTAPATA